VLGNTDPQAQRFTVSLRDPITHRVVRELEGHTGAICCLTFAPDGSWLASVSDDRAGRLWDLNTGQLKGGVLGSGMFRPGK
jgi:WD40 repeat protein